MTRRAAKLFGAALAGLAIAGQALPADSPVQKKDRVGASVAGRADAYVEDSVITAKVKAALLRAPELRSRDVEVETDHGRVLLTGVVRTQAERDHALKTAASVDGVLDVKDALVVR
jgi:hyperosmotically inducible periplasmic protein